MIYFVLGFNFWFLFLNYIHLILRHLRSIIYTYMGFCVWPVKELDQLYMHLELNADK